ncbi:hypothetical protein BU25DRAFT_489369 [Macroventuria anomochaeta]|uniref:Uncharacterized protein n=1 Tax=Macroventuria anomochaeta TaxID=301207 RepID=A0ACB6SA28_9PLEO|nr:uncharacterized protein BU25DRAFT_489369 [Macroventuria anomochaeta]KAF2629962.1 hypothetical protein BU25DRAFT_489369 [Macroventuria anomochaeta]
MSRKTTPTPAMYNTVDSSIITVVVGPESNHRSFKVHEPLLKARSENFENALKPGRSIEGDERVIRFPHEDPEIFSLYSRLLDLYDKISFFDGKEQPPAIPAEALRALFQGLPDCLDGDDLCLATACRYNMYGTDHGTELSDHLKLLRASVESMPVEFLRTLIFDLYEDRPPMKEWDHAQEQIKKKDKEIKRLETRLAELENCGCICLFAWLATVHCNCTARLDYL